MFRFLVPASLAIVAIIFIDKGVSVCLQCMKGTADDACRKANSTYETTLAEDDKICTNIKANSSFVSSLCKTFPKGYKIVCGKDNSTSTCEGTCSGAVPTGLRNVTPVLVAVLALLIITT